MNVTNGDRFTQNFHDNDNGNVLSLFVCRLKCWAGHIIIGQWTDIIISLKILAAKVIYSNDNRRALKMKVFFGFLCKFLHWIATGISFFPFFFERKQIFSFNRNEICYMWTYLYVYCIHILDGRPFRLKASIGSYSTWMIRFWWFLSYFHNNLMFLCALRLGIDKRHRI